MNWITSLNRNEVSAKTDYIETVNSVAKSYLIKVNAESTYSTLAVINGLQTEITSNTVAITGIQNELIMLGIASVVNGLFTFTSQIISSSVLSAEIAKCMKIQG